MADKAKAARLRQAMEVARAGTEFMRWADVAIQAGVSPTTLDNWIYGRTIPRLRQLAMVADVLGVPAADLQAAYEGLEPPRAPIEEELRALVPEVRELVLLLRAQADQVILEEVQAALAARRRGSGRSPSERPSEGDG